MGKKIVIGVGDIRVIFRERTILEINGASMLHEDDDNSEIIKKFILWAEKASTIVHRNEFEYIFTLYPSVKASLNSLLKIGSPETEIPKEFAIILQAGFKYAETFQREHKETLQICIWFDAEAVHDGT